MTNDRYPVLFTALLLMAHLAPINSVNGRLWTTISSERQAATDEAALLGTAPKAGAESGTSGRPTQDSLDSFAFKGTHNSYDRGIPLDVQIDDYNVWCIELDICCPDPDGGDYQVWVGHGVPEQPFGDWLQEMVQSRAWAERVTFLWLDIKHEDVCNHWPTEAEYPPGGWLQLVIDELSGFLPPASIYSHREFEVDDGAVWPSLTSLLERDRRFIVILDGGHWDTDKPYHDTFFVTAESLQQVQEYGYWWVTVINRLDGGLPAGEVPLTGDRYIWRAWNLNEETKYRLAAANGFNILSTDEAGESWTFAGVHPPVPLIVDAESGVEPDDGQYGTWRFPVEMVSVGVEWAAPNTSVIIKAGSYNEQLIVSKPLTLRAEGGVAVIGSP